MARKQRRYPPEFGQEIVALAREFEPTASAIRKWIKQSDLDEGHGNGRLDDIRAPGVAPGEAEDQAAADGAGHPKKAKEAGIRRARRRHRKAGFTRWARKARPAPDLVNRNFTVEGPDRLWVAEPTYVHTQAGW
jgi:transposase-like protein